MNATATFRKLASAVTLLVFSICVVTCLGMQPAQGKSHDCCPRTDTGQSQGCPQKVSATACSLSSLDLPKSNPLVWQPVGVLITFVIAAPDGVSGDAASFLPPRSTGDAYLHNRVLRI